MRITVQYQVEKDDHPVKFLHEAYTRCQSFDRLRFNSDGRTINYTKDAPLELRCMHRLWDGQFDDASLATAIRHLNNVADNAMESAPTSMAPDAIQQAAQNLADRIIELRQFIAQEVRDARVRDSTLVIGEKAWPESKVKEILADVLEQAQILPVQDGTHIIHSSVVHVDDLTSVLARHNITL